MFLFNLILGSKLYFPCTCGKVQKVFFEKRNDDDDVVTSDVDRNISKCTNHSC